MVRLISGLNIHVPCIDMVLSLPCGCGPPNIICGEDELDIICVCVPIHLEEQVFGTIFRALVHNHLPES